MEVEEEPAVGEVRAVECERMDVIHPDEVLDDERRPQQREEDEE
jgi:hypothetical protein